MKPWKAEIIAIGDEMISGQRLDTNSQWLSRELADLGIEPRFHATVGDDLDDGISAFQAAIGRADFVISTGGIGPTKDDLTRQVLADVAGVELRFHPQVIERIKKIFRRYDKEMPENNAMQAWFPDGATIMSNREGTAPGIDQVVHRDGRQVRVFAMPGVPYEMKEMWADHVRPAIRATIGASLTIVHHVIDCFGSGESTIEMMLDGLTQRGRQPRVGITASQGTISLRITATGNDPEQCRASIADVASIIRQRLGNLVYGENGASMQDIVSELLASRHQTAAFIDYGFGGVASGWLRASCKGPQVHAGCIVLPPDQISRWLHPSNEPQPMEPAPSPPAEVAEAAARRVRCALNSDFGIAIGPPTTIESKLLPEYPIAIATADSCHCWQLSCGGHSGLREARTTKQILNQIRLFLLGLV